MNAKQTKTLVILLSVLVLASCAKKMDDTQTNTGNTSDTSAAEEQLLSDINEVISSLDNSGTVENTGAQVSPGATQSETIATQTEQKVMKLNQTYKTPGGNDEAEFSISLNGDIIEDVSIKTIVGGDITQKLHAAFGDAINGQIKGKTLADVEGLSAVGGASLTTKAFIAAVKSM